MEINLGTPSPQLQMIRNGIEDATRQFLASASIDVSSAFKRYAVRMNKVDADYVKHLVDLMMQEIEWNKLALYFSEELANIYSLGGQEAINQLQIKEGTDALREAAAAYARNRAAEMVGRKWIGDRLVDNPAAEWAITETTRNELRELISSGLDAGLSLDEIAEQIKLSTLFSSYRAKMIAASEVALAQVQGGLEVWKRSGKIKTVKIVLSDAHPKTDICDDIEGEYAIEDCPRVPIHPFCLCSIIPGEVEIA